MKHEKEKKPNAAAKPKKAVKIPLEKLIKTDDLSERDKKFLNDRIVILSI